ncbi:uncharacterized protein KGF55_003443 [Candida pseudojiufengensis]|uniref:uncharacterized protein n=1 Tax=Candida pseudojiufengensis TaxID=497109 RepID=UPI0022247A09|nr:uncharacterized protein KGF55_003443 [Candida pseudojiufengensis]KAI5962367.1 hypothetical protein KGF55_003443 [Candida pseudojiufengensis]
MEIFLKLPAELLNLIIKYINDESKLEELILLIPTLKKYALRARFSEYKLGNSNTSDGSVESLHKLYNAYNFKPSRIILDADKLSVLLGLKKSITESQETLNSEVEIMKHYGQAEFEIFLQDGMYVDLNSIFKKVNVVGVHLSEFDPFLSEPDSFTEFDINEIKSYLEIIQSSKIEFMTTVYGDDFAYNFPTSLKKLSIVIVLKDNRIMDKINLKELQCLEYFDCWYLSGIKSLDDLQLTKTIRSIRLFKSHFKNWGSIKDYDNLRSLEIYEFDYLFDIFKCTFPESLEKLILRPEFNQSDIAELYRDVKEGINNHFEISDFSGDGKYLQIGSNFKLPSNPKVLNIRTDANCLELGYNPNLAALNNLELIGIKFKLNEFLLSLPIFMRKLTIIDCEVTDVGGDLRFPKVRECCFTFNQVSNIFQIDLKGMVNLYQLEIMNNFLVLPSTEKRIIDPCQFLSGEFDVLDETSKFFKKRKISKVSETLKIELSDIKYLKLSKFRSDSSEISDLNNSNDFLHLPSQICIIGCTSLQVLQLSGLGIQILDLHKFPLSLRDIRIEDLKLIEIKGDFSLLNQLEKLWLVNNGITYSMLVQQKFPSTLISLNLSSNPIEDLTCLQIDNCKELHHLKLNRVTGSLNPNGANELKKTFVELIGKAADTIGSVTTYDSKVKKTFLELIGKAADTIGSVTTYDSKVVFSIVEGVDKA